MPTKSLSFPYSLLLLVIIIGSLTGCADLSYYLHSINGHLSIINKARDIEDILADENTDPDLAERLRLVGRIRHFAVNQLQLPESDSYSIYADLNRSYALKNLFAAKEFSIEAHHWCYPIVGCAGYRGFFDDARLQRFESSLKQQGFDVYIARVSAYSTLGWFDDPVLNTFINWPEYRLAGMIFHELTHQQLYIEGDTTFNESFAVAVQQAGVKKWLKANGKSMQADRYQQLLDNRQQVIELIKLSREELKKLYQQDLSGPDKRKAKTVMIEKLVHGYIELSEQFAIADGFKRWFEEPINNAKLVSISTYYSQVPAFQHLLHSHEQNFQSFFQHVKAIAGLPLLERTECMNYWKSDANDESSLKHALTGNFSSRAICQTLSSAVTAAPTEINFSAGE